MLNYVLHMKDHYRSNHLFVPMGCDFTYLNAILNFKSMDALMDYFNSHAENITLIYSTPGQYIDILVS